MCWKEILVGAISTLVDTVQTVWSIRIGEHYRALARCDGDLVVWFWTGTDEEYNNLTRQLC
jgi:hypothetical protein